jgi:hypothetical protein
MLVLPALNSMIDIEMTRTIAAYLTGARRATMRRAARGRADTLAISARSRRHRVGVYQIGDV